MKKLLDLRVILIVLLVLSWGAAGALIYFKSQDTSEQLAAKDAQIAELNQNITDVGELVPAYTVVADVPSGKKLEETDISEIEVPVSMSTNLVQSSEELVGKYCKLAMTAGTVFTIDSIYEEPITADMRYYDVIVDTYPIGLKPGAFVDIRIRYGKGSDFIGISHRQVVEINGSTLKLILTEEDIQNYNSMLIEDIIFNERFAVNYDTNEDGKVNEGDTHEAIGCMVYALEYVEGGMQEVSTNTYVPSTLIQALMEGNPNISTETLTPEERILYRNNIEMITDVKDSDVAATASRLKEYIGEIIKEGRQEYERRQAQEAEEAEELGEVVE